MWCNSDFLHKENGRVGRGGGGEGKKPLKTNEEFNCNRCQPTALSQKDSADFKYNPLQVYQEFLKNHLPVQVYQEFLKKSLACFQAG